MKQDKKKELEFFNRHIDNHCDYDVLSAETFEEVLDKSGLLNSDIPLRMLDTGCGTGVWTERLALRGYSVYGVDISLKMVQAGVKRRSAGKTPFTLIAGDIEMLPFKAASFDVCFGGGVLHHFPSLDNALKEMKRVLKHNGRICFLEPNGSNPIMRLSYLLRGFLDHFIDSSGTHATVNEHTHKNEFYERQCRQHWQNFRLIPIHVKWVDPSHTGWFRIGITMRDWIMDAMNRLLPERYGCSFVIIIGE